MKRSYSILILLCILFSTSWVSAQVADQKIIKKDVTYLASDSLEGRKPGTKSCDLAAEYIRKGFKEAGLTFINDEAFQYFQVTTDIKTGDHNELSVNGTPYTLNKDYLPFSFSANASLTSTVAFAGYGFDFVADTTKWDDYQNLDVKGKWVLIFRGNPEPDKENSMFLPYSKERSKVLAAKDKGAAGVLLVTGVVWDKNDELANLSYDKSKSGSGIPVIHIKRELANKILEASGVTIENLEAEINKSRLPKSMLVQAEVSATTDVQLTSVRTQNVIGVLPGKDAALKDQVIVVGAHYDHLGWGGPGSGSRYPDTVAVHNGADDNASGTAALMELARMLKHLKTPLRKTVVFVAFSAEEMGLLGSSWYTSHPVYPLNKTDLMINFDMVGRMNKAVPAISVGGTGTFNNAETLLNELLTGRSFKASYSPEGYGPSDHAPFYADSVPVLYFNTGAHTDYHTPGDDAQLLNYTGIAGITDLACDLIKKIDTDPQPLVFMEAGPKEKVSHGGGLKVRLGIMPDFVNTEVKGVAVGGVSKGGPAEHSGLLKGDVITALNGKPVTNIYEYMDRMKTFTVGQTISVDVTRNNTLLVFLIQL